MEVEQINLRSDEENKSEDNLVESEELVKHPLQNKWEFWYFKPNRARNWFDNLYNINCFDTVEDFWALYNHIEIPSKLPFGCDYNFFKFGIKPIWEDERNKKGGRLVLVYKKGTLQPKMLDEVWLDILLCLIGEAFGDESDKVNGAVLNVRPKHDRIAIWTSDCKDEASIRKIVEILKKRIIHIHEIMYEVHDSKMNVKNDKNPLYMFF